ncbi:MAG TPA: NADH-quinone oxidoreductase subunit H, partial [Rhizomicrobium sp.]|nr:NADH-quinone oxidoreductase subunit H [Rhizomicrobium sp.]
LDGFAGTGWSWLASLHGLIIFAIKTIMVFFANAMVRAVVPRYRYDQLMRLGWKVFLPTSLVWVALTGAWIVFGRGVI